MGLQPQKFLLRFFPIIGLGGKKQMSIKGFPPLALGHTV